MGPSAPRADAVRVRTTPKILVADDDDGLRRLVDRMLRLGGFDAVQHARDGIGVAVALDAWRPDVVLLDWHMPSGGDALVRRAASCAATVLMTGERGLRSLDVPCGVLEKPFCADELLAAVSAALVTSDRGSTAAAATTILEAWTADSSARTTSWVH